MSLDFFNIKLGSQCSLMEEVKQVWDLTGQKLFNFEGHEAPVYSICPHHKDNIQVSQMEAKGSTVFPFDFFVIAAWEAENRVPSGNQFIDLIQNSLYSFMIERKMKLGTKSNHIL